MAAPSYTLSQQERSFYATLYSSIHGGPQGVSADAVVNLFAKATPTLSTTVLGEVWNLADYQSSGTLTTQGFEIACRLVGHGQAGQSISQDLINRRALISACFDVAPPLHASAQPDLCPNSKASPRLLSVHSLPDSALPSTTPALSMLESRRPIERSFCASFRRRARTMAYLAVRRLLAFARASLDQRSRRQSESGLPQIEPAADDARRHLVSSSDLLGRSDTLTISQATR